MTWPHDDPDQALTKEQEAALKESRGCGGCLYTDFGPGLTCCCTHPEHPCWDGRSLSRWCLGCPDRVPREGVSKKPHPAPVRLGNWCEEIFQQRIAERRRQAA